MKAVAMSVYVFFVFVFFIVLDGCVCLLMHGCVLLPVDVVFLMYVFHVACRS